MSTVHISFDGGDKAEEIVNAIRQSGTINYANVEGNTVQVAVGSVEVEE